MGKKSKVPEARKMATISTSKNIDEEIQKFHGLGLDNWLTDQCKAMGLKKPTEIQQNCIPPILRGNGFSPFYMSYFRVG